jgi:hypothetical protein
MNNLKEAVKKIVLILPAMGGILLDKFNFNRILLLLLLAVIYLIFRYLNGITDIYSAAGIFLTYFAARYLFLFFSFTRNGIAERIKINFGEEEGFEIYKSITAVMFFIGGMSFSLLVIKSGITIPFSGIYTTIFNTAGIALALSGLVINTWATYLVGVDIYYYKDLFVGRKISEFKNEGPYKIFSNPMYGPGQANGYGTALIYGSAAGITGMLMNQVMMYIFFYTIEKPHIIRILRKEEEQKTKRKIAG